MSFDSLYGAISASAASAQQFRAATSGPSSSNQGSSPRAERRGSFPASVGRVPMKAKELSCSPTARPRCAWSRGSNSGAAGLSQTRSRLDVMDRRVRPAPTSALQRGRDGLAGRRWCNGLVDPRARTKPEPGRSMRCGASAAQLALERAPDREILMVAELVNEGSGPPDGGLGERGSSGGPLPRQWTNGRSGRHRYCSLAHGDDVFHPCSRGQASRMVVSKRTVAAAGKAELEIQPSRAAASARGSRSGEDQGHL